MTPRSPYMCVDEAAAYLGRTPRTIRELCRTNRIPHRKLAGGSSPCMFVRRELDEWVDGASLIVEPTPAHGGRVVRVDLKERSAA